MSSRRLHIKTRITSTPSLVYCDDDENSIVLSTDDIDDILVSLGDKSSRSAETSFS